MAEPHGWLALCLPAPEIAKSIEFYEQLDFTLVNGSAEQEFAVMQQRNHEIHLHMDCISAPMLNFRGGDVRAIVAELKQRGLSPVPGHVESDGEAVDVGGCTTACYFDPDGLEVMFDTHPDEARWLAQGEPFCTQGALDKLKPGPILLGNLSYCLTCRDIHATVDFYQRLGWFLTGDFLQHNWGVMTQEEHPEWRGGLNNGMHLSVFQDMLSERMLNWRGGNVFAIAETLRERGVELDQEPYTDDQGSDNLFLTDPAGHKLYFNTYPQERLY